MESQDFDFPHLISNILNFVLNESSNLMLHSSLTIYGILSGLRQLLLPNGSKNIRHFSSLIIIGTFLLIQVPAFVGYIDTIKTLRQVLPERKEAIELIMELTSEEDTVLI